jgi:hypothetical protein
MVKVFKESHEKDVERLTDDPHHLKNRLIDVGDKS